MALSEYLSTLYRPDCDYLDGVLLERNLGERSHGSVVMGLIAYFHPRQNEWNIDALLSIRMQISPTRFRVTDFAVLFKSDCEEQTITSPPFICIEVLSHADPVDEMQERIDDYLRFGVPNVWTIDPRTRRCFTYTLFGPVEVTDGVLRTCNPDIFLPVAELFN